MSHIKPDADAPDHMPAHMMTAQGKPRRIGVEIELAGLDLDQLSALVMEEFGGQCEDVSAYECKVVNTTLGDFKLELDFDYLKQLALSQKQDEPNELERLATEALGELAQTLVPFELVTPPIHLACLPRIDHLISRLRQAGAKGTRHAARFAFGLHLNPELPDTDSDTLLRYFKAYLCLHDWLSHRESVELTRKLLVYIKPFGQDYVNKVVDPQYWPDLDTFIEDYLAYNPTRNRCMDMLPIFRHLRPELVDSAILDSRIKSRPTLHYRLPNSDIDSPDWGIMNIWQHWLVVEALANDRDLLDQMGAAYQRHISHPMPDWVSPWYKKASQWIEHVHSSQ